MAVRNAEEAEVLESLVHCGVMAVWPLALVMLVREVVTREASGFATAMASGPETPEPLIVTAFCPIYPAGH